ATQMHKAGLAMAADAPEQPTPPTTQAPTPVTNPPETTTPVPTPEPTPAPTTLEPTTSAPDKQKPSPGNGADARVMDVPKMHQQVRDAQSGNKHISSGADKGSQECVALLKTFRSDLGSTKDWKAGAPVKDNGGIEPGDALGKGFDKDGNYPSNSAGNHAIVITEVERDTSGKVVSVKIAEQWAARPAHGNRGPRAAQPVRERTLTPDEIDEYRVIERRK
ncbi:MAG: BPSL0067 family protein, partial [Alphaproteobacteria bacterium]|nr:BPSL0067 family protein [Alphaproteobacteria bacterium]